MDVSAILWSVLTAGASLAASGAVGEFGKSGGKAAFEALKGLLTRKGADSVALVAKADQNPAYAEAIRTDLARPEITGDPDILAAAETLRAALAALPPHELTAYGVDIREIVAAKAVLIEGNQGVRVDSLRTDDTLTIRNNTAPGKK